MREPFDLICEMATTQDAMIIRADEAKAIAINYNKNLEKHIDTLDTSISQSKKITACCITIGLMLPFTILGVYCFVLECLNK